MQKRVIAGGPLLTGQGRLVEGGYALGALKHYDDSLVKAAPLQKRKWTLIHIFSDACVFLVHLHAAFQKNYCELVLYHRPSGKTRAFQQALGKGEALFGDEVTSDVRYLDARFALNLRHKPDGLHLYGHAYDFFGKDRSLMFDFILQPASLTPMAYLSEAGPKPQYFTYQHLTPAMPADGRMMMDGAWVYFSGGAAAANVLWQRGAWRAMDNVLLTAAGRSGDGPVALWLAQGLGLDRHATSNAVLTPQGLIKLAAVSVDRAAVKAGNPVRVKGLLKDVDLTFTPQAATAACCRHWLHALQKQSVIGTLSGAFLRAAGQSEPLPPVPCALLHWVG